MVKKWPFRAFSQKKFFKKGLFNVFLKNFAPLYDFGPYLDFLEDSQDFFQL